MANGIDLDLEQFSEMRRFYLVHLEEEPGSFESGIAACGVVLPEPNGRVVLGWLTDPASVEVFGSLDDLLERHERPGTTEVVFPTDLD